MPEFRATPPPDHPAEPAMDEVVLVCTGIRPEEKMLLAAFQARGVPCTVVDDRTLHGDLGGWPRGLPRVRRILLRSKSHGRNVALARWLEALGAAPLNSSRILECCGDKVSTTLALLQAGVPALSASVAFSVDGGCHAGQALGFPLVVKPSIGSWGRLVGRVNDPDALETLLEHKEALASAAHAVSYLQRFVSTAPAPGSGVGGRDIRSFVIGGQTVAAIERTSTHWRTNTHLGGRASALSMTPELASVSQAAAQAVGAVRGAVAVDLFETPDGYRVNEVNGTMEFRNSVHTTGVDLPGLLADLVLEQTPTAAPAGRA